MNNTVINYKQFDLGKPAKLKSNKRFFWAMCAWCSLTTLKLTYSINPVVCLEVSLMV